MFRKLATIALASLAIAAPASAQLTRMPGEYGGFSFMAQDEKGQTHSIETVRQDREGDYYIDVQVNNGPKTYYWIDCAKDLISDNGAWREVDHRKMEGYYSDATCRPEMGTSIGYQMGMMTYEEDRQFFRGERR